ncbi:MAG: hypothetical protein COU08_04385 [Candidatus Harrisonbacteria bacterium CG10_big_fil_rev_8_21_14_0_10_42_17]|uniref:DM13 domain-containing protein n=1 Tax=Candidatus Harrisonbacteria bacterium CG10_big_fil_rev_8_21_14_0_10_42_17 TaxID=1974584 RepID=A0A2M6WGZ4_9BACT|nr:MAG: hypothetical protein COU08_04385 [Candidatus Harrisonbacteria bacterium CG10_big_fil_rev_8_21_14_0_10_42_17]
MTPSMKKIFVIIVVLLALGVGWYLASPLFLNKEVDEALPDSVVQSDSQLIASGMFMDADSFHQGSGTAKVYKLADNSVFVRFEDFKVTNGPDLHVIVSDHPRPTSRNDFMGGLYLDLGSLKGNIGNQNYVLPEGYQAGDIKSVIIYCKPFHVLFALAELNKP